LLFNLIVIHYYNQSNRGKDFLIYYNDNKNFRHSKKQKGSKIPQGRVWARGISPCILNSGGVPAKRTEIETMTGRAKRKGIGGRNFYPLSLSPSPLNFVFRFVKCATKKFCWPFVKNFIDLITASGNSICKVIILKLYDNTKGDFKP